MKKRLIGALFLLTINIVLLVPGLVIAQSGAYADLSTAQRILISLTYFMNSVLMPLLFGIALLFFLVNATRFFIIEGGDESGREKARRLATYGILGFVFLASIWGIVNLFISGFGWEQERSICPDYLGGWCGNDGARSAGGSSGRVVIDTYAGGFDSGRTVTDTYNGVGTADVNGADDTVSTNGTDDEGGVSPSGGSGQSAVANVLDGEFADQSELSFEPGAPRAADATVDIDEMTACISGMNALQQASEYENTQAAYLFYTDSIGNTQWTNVTDQTSVDSVIYDADTITSIKNSGATDLYLIHTHQADNLSLVGLDTNGYPPSSDDMDLLCDTTLSGINQVVVDWNNVWLMEQPTDACPRRSDESNQFDEIESLLWLSQVSTGDRAQEFEDLINADNITSELRNDLQPYLSNSLDGMTIDAIADLSSQAQEQANLDITRTDASIFCGSA